MLRPAPSLGQYPLRSWHGSASSGETARQRVPKRANLLGNFVEQPVKGYVELGIRLISAIGDGRAERLDAFPANVRNLGKLAGDAAGLGDFEPIDRG
jgi:hypothetical protein